MKLKHSLPKEAVEAIQFIPEGDGEAGWFVWLKQGWSFDPGADDTSRFVPADDPSEVDDFIVFKLEAA